MCDIDTILREILSSIRAMPPELSPLLDSFGRILAEPVFAQRNLPPRDHSSKDGYAFKHPGEGRGELKLTVVENLGAGHTSNLCVGAGQAIKIMTGATLPDGVDTIAPVEDTSAAGDEVLITNIPASGANVRLAGEDVKVGVELLPEGTKIRPAEIGMLAAQGRSYVRIYRRPKVGILATGNEIAEIDRPDPGARIVNSNSYSLAAMAIEAGAIPILLGIGKDDPAELLKLLEDASDCDILITTGGISMGDFDFIPDVFREFGVRLAIDKERMKPRKPMFFGMRGPTAVFGLTGNPVSSMVYFEQFVRPTIKKMLGYRNFSRPLIKALYGSDLAPVRCKGGETEYVSCRVEKKGGRYQVTSIRFRDYWMMSTIERVNSFLVLEPGVGTVRAGDKVLVQLYDYESMEEN